MAQFELIMFATDFELDRPDIARAAAPGDGFLNVRIAHFEIVIEKSSWIDRQSFPALAEVLNREIREFDFFAGPVFHTHAVRRLVFRLGVSATNWTRKRQQAAEQENESRITSYVPEVLGLFYSKSVPSAQSVVRLSENSCLFVSICG